MTTIKPFFFVEYCQQVHFSTRHDPKKYSQMRELTISAIEQVIPGLSHEQLKETKIPTDYLSDAQVDLTNGGTRPYSPSLHLLELADLQYNRNLPSHPGAFEVYFMGVRLFSKIQSGVWPNPVRVAERAAQAYKAYYAGKDIDEFETQVFGRRATVRDDVDVTSQSATSVATPATSAKPRTAGRNTRQKV